MVLRKSAEVMGHDHSVGEFGFAPCSLTKVHTFRKDNHLVTTTKVSSLASKFGSVGGPPETPTPKIMFSPCSAEKPPVPCAFPRP